MLDMLLAFLLPIPEFATSQEYSAYRVVPANAPIKIDACEATQAKQRGVIAHSSIAYGAAFTLLGQKPARRVLLRFAFDDRNWHPVASKDEEITGTFQPGTQISRTHQVGGNFRQNGAYKDAAAVVCTPVEIDFVDGSVWHGVEVPSTKPVPANASPVPASSNTAPAATPVDAE